MPVLRNKDYYKEGWENDHRPIYDGAAHASARFSIMVTRTRTGLT